MALWVQLWALSVQLSVQQSAVLWVLLLAVLSVPLWVVLSAELSVLL